MKTIDDALKYADTFDKPANKHMSIVMLASEVRRLRDEINGLTGSLDRAEKALKEAQEQKPVAWINLNKWTPSNGPQCVTHEEYEKERELLTKLTAVYAAPVPAVAVPAIDIETILDASTATMCQCLRSRLLASEVRRLRALLQSNGCSSQTQNEVRHD